MSSVVLVHGIAQQFKGPETLLDFWYPALCDGLSLSGGGVAVRRSDVTMAFYGDLFRPSGHRGLGVPELDASDVTDPLEHDLLMAWWEEAARHEPAVPAPHDRTRLRTPHVVQRALDALSHSAFFAGLGERLMVASLRQVRRYLTEPDTRRQVRERVTSCLSERTRVVVAHSLGSVIAYEALCARRGLHDVTLVTLGSPLAIRTLVFDRLEPAPHGGRAMWPAALANWTNVADSGDVVALVKSLAPGFGEGVRDVLVHNGPRAHDVRPYLTAGATGAAVAAGLRAGH